VSSEQRDIRQAWGAGLGRRAKRRIAASASVEQQPAVAVPFGDDEARGADGGTEGTGGVHGSPGLGAGRRGREQRRHCLKQALAGLASSMFRARPRGQIGSRSRAMVAIYQEPCVAACVGSRLTGRPPAADSRRRARCPLQPSQPQRRWGTLEGGGGGGGVRSCGR